MTNRTLKNPPLIEAIFELKWQPQESPHFPGYDPHYNLLIGRLYERLGEEYPIHEPLPTSIVPGDIVQGLVQHRLRTGENQWPVIQLGPGIFTVNETVNYTWQAFEQRIMKGINTLLDIYPDAKTVANSLTLRYINGLEFDFEKESVLQFLKHQMKIDISLHPPLFERAEIEELPLGFNYVFTFYCANPIATITLKLARGKKQNADAIIWETIFRTLPGGIPELPGELEPWLNDAHGIVEDWFFKLIAGDLEKRFA